MNLRRRLTLLIVLLLAAGAVALAWLLWRATPPKTARLLPDADGYFYIDVATLRRAGALNNLPAVEEAPDYRAFIDATGIRPERDLDTAAFAIHTPQTGGDDTRFSEVFTGHVDRRRATDYFRKIAEHNPTYHDVEIFFIAHEGRTVRVAFLNDHAMAVSNSASDDAIYTIIDRSRRFRPVRGPALLREYYDEAPLTSLAWLIMRVEGLPQQSAILSSQLRQMLAGAVLVGSVRYLGSLEVRLQALTESESQAQQLAENANGLLQIYRAAETSLQAGGSDTDVKSALRSLRVEQQGSQVTLAADIPTRVLQKLLTASEAETAPAAIPPVQKRAPASSTHARRQREKRTK